MEDFGATSARADRRALPFILAHDLGTMKPDQQPDREKEIFENALEIASAEERHGYIKGACGGDADLLSRAQALLNAHEEATGFLREKPAAANKTIRLGESAVTEGPGTVIG